MSGSHKWTPEQRQAASERAKRHWAIRHVRESEARLQEEMRIHRQQTGAIGQVRAKITEFNRKKEQARAAYFAAEAQEKELQTTLDALLSTVRVLGRHGISGMIG